jgi:Zn-dependent protease with chaperone function
MADEQKHLRVAGRRTERSIRVACGLLLMSVFLAFSISFFSEWRLAAVPLGLIFLGFAASFAKSALDRWREP